MITKPKKLSDKLLAIRGNLNLSQRGIVDAMGLSDSINHIHISHYERGLREPSLPVILNYARLAKVPVETLIDDKLSLPLS